MPKTPTVVLTLAQLKDLLAGRRVQVQLDGAALALKPCPSAASVLPPTRDLVLLDRFQLEELQCGARVTAHFQRYFQHRAVILDVGER
jgi:hypothetical protein